MTVHAPLLPLRHPHADFFLADIFDSIPVKNDRHTMEHPFFALSTKPDIREVRYRRDGVSITLSPHHRLGLPTMMDKDILLYCGSLLMKEINAGRLPPKTMRFSAHDLMITTNRMTNGQAYAQLKNAFERLAGCLITTDIKTNGIRIAGGFHILESYYVVESSHDKKRMVRLEVTVSDWFYNALIGKEVLTINREYFRLRKPLERRLYELARKHCGKQPSWQIGLENLQEKCGALSPLNKFRFQLRAIIHPDHLPDYQMALDAHDMVTFANRYHIVKQALSMASVFPGMETLPTLTPATLARGAQLVEKAGTGWDYDAIVTQFHEQLARGFTPLNANAAFIGFVKKKITRRA
jgi:plasmid replication initiation protein